MAKKAAISDAENYEQIIKNLESKNEEQKKSAQRYIKEIEKEYEDEIENLKNTIKALDEVLGNARKELKQIDVLKNKLSGYKKVIQFLVGIENGDVLTSEVK